MSVSASVCHPDGTNDPTRLIKAGSLIRPFSLSVIRGDQQMGEKIARLSAYAKKMCQSKIPAYFHTLLKWIHKYYPLEILLIDLRSLLSIALPFHHLLQVP